jgi:carboxylesterase
VAGDQEKTAILLIHGILGTPSHFAPFLSLIPPAWHICNLSLKGHGGSVTDFSRASMAEWKQQVKNALEELLETNNKVMIAAHSMGTLFAIQQAIEKPVDALFLLNVPLKVRVTFRLFRTAWSVFTGKIKPDDSWSLAAQNAYSIERDYHILRYLGWVPRYLELFSEIRKTRKIIGELSTPAYIYLSVQDEMVSPKCREICRDNRFVCVKMLENSGHFYYSPEDQRLMKEDFHRMVQQIQNETSG